jgi:hypothetical protein
MTPAEQQVLELWPAFVVYTDDFAIEDSLRIWYTGGDIYPNNHSIA